jgi:hypothetical protein
MRETPAKGIQLTVYSISNLTKVLLVPVFLFFLLKLRVYCWISVWAWLSTRSCIG